MRPDSVEAAALGCGGAVLREQVPRVGLEEIDAMPRGAGRGHEAGGVQELLAKAEELRHGVRQKVAGWDRDLHVHRNIL